MALSGDDDKLIKNYTLFISLRENRSIVDKETNIKRCLNEGADVNAADGNDGGNTPLARLLLDNGADRTNKNWSGDTPLDITRTLHYEGIEEVVNFLQAIDRLVSDNNLPSRSRSQNSCIVFENSNSNAQTLCNISQSDCQEAIPNNIQENAQPEFKYLKKPGTSAVKGHLLETKLCCLYDIKSRNDPQIEQFYLGTNIRGIGDMDDICLRYQMKNQVTPVLLFVQAKHTGKGVLTVEHVRSFSGDYSMYKYFDTYLMLKDQFQVDNKDPMFKGHFNKVNCFFVLLTTAKDSFTKKKPDAKIDEKVLSYIKIGQDANVFRYDYSENDIKTLTKTTVQKQIIKLGAAFLRLIIPAKGTIKADMTFVDKLIAKYHVVLRQEMLQKCNKQPATKEYRNWKFRHDFFGNGVDEYLVALRNTFVTELSKNRYDKSEISDQDEENFKEALTCPCVYTFSKLFGKLATYNDKTKKLEFVKSDVLKSIKEDVEFKPLWEQFNSNIIEQDIIHDAIITKLKLMTIELSSSFGNVDMTFSGDKYSVKKRIKTVADNIIKLLDLNRDTKVVEINDDVVGQGKLIQQGVIDINGGIGSAVGNLLIFDTKTKMLKFDLENEALPDHAALLLAELKNDRHKPVNDILNQYRIKVCIDRFPKSSFYGDDNDEKIARNYLNNLWIGVNQAKHDEVEDIIKSHITKYYTDEEYVTDNITMTNYIFFKYHESILKWWMETDKASYLTRTFDLFKSQNPACNNILMPTTMLIHSMPKDMNHLFQLCSDLLKIFDTQIKMFTIDEKRKKEIGKLRTIQQLVGNVLRRSDESEDFDDTLPYSQNYVKPKYPYMKSSATSGVVGHLYETKLLCLVLLRALKDEKIEDFLLGTNIHGIGDIDDICLRYRVRGQVRPGILFVQAKHRQNRRLTVGDMQRTFGDFSLRKYFNSYLMIKNRFRVNNEDPMFEGDFSEIECNLVIYTPAKDFVTKKNIQHPLSERVSNLINTGEYAEAFQYDYDEKAWDFLNYEQIKIFGKVFLNLIMSENVEPQLILHNKLIAKYHMVMARDVLRECSIQEVDVGYRIWEFRPEFFESDCEYLITLKKIFVKELSSKCCGKSEITNQDRENFNLFLQNPCAHTISKLIGRLTTYNDKTKKLELLARNIFNTSEFKTILEQFDEILYYENVISEAIQIKLATMKIKLPMSFGNLDMTFRGSDAKVQKRMKFVADKLIDLLKSNLDTMILDINDGVVGSGKSIEQRLLDINGGIGGAVGNLLVLDPDTKMLKFDLDNKALPDKAALFLKELKDARHKPLNEKLSYYRFKVNVDGFPIYGWSEDEYGKGQVKDFLSKLWFYTNQAKEDEVEYIVKNEIYNRFNGIDERPDFKVHSHVIFLRAYDVLQKWWMQPNAASYLSKNDDIFHRAMYNGI